MKGGGKNKADTDTHLFELPLVLELLYLSSSSPQHNLHLLLHCHSKPLSFHKDIPLTIQCLVKVRHGMNVPDLYVMLSIYHTESILD